MAWWRGLRDIGQTHGPVDSETVIDHQTGLWYRWPGHGDTVTVRRGRDHVADLVIDGDHPDASRRQALDTIERGVRSAREAAPRRQDGGAVTAAPVPPSAATSPSRVAQLRRDALPFAIAAPSGVVDGYLNAMGGAHMLTWPSTFWRAGQLVGGVGLARVNRVPLRAAETVAVDGAFGLSSRIFEAVSQAIFKGGA